MGIIQDFDAGRMERLRSIKYSETGTESPYVTTEPSVLNSITQFFPDEASRRISDTVRIAKMLVDKPGLKWIGNQTLLSREELERKAREAAEQKNGTGVGNALAAFGAAAGQVLKIVGSTVAQVPVNGTGTHFVRAFKTDTYLQPAGEDPAGPFAQFFGAGGIEGAPLALNGETIIPDNEGQQDYKPLHSSDLKDRQANADKNSRFSLENGVYKYPYGNRNSDLLNDDNVSIGVPITSDESTTVERTTKLIDYRNLEGRNYRTGSYALNYSDAKINKETRVGLGNQGKKKINITNYTDIDEDRVDKLNAQPTSLEALDGAEEVRDLISLNFEIITPEQSMFLYFRAYLDQFSDSYSADWGATKYIGRAEDFYTYNGFTRQVSIGFKVAASSRVELNPIYQKIATLASVTTPTYGGTESKFMRGTIARVTVGDYLYKVPGIIESVDFTWQTDYPWEINMQGPEGNEDTMPVVPHLLDCSLSFKPIHNFIPQATYFRTPGTALIRNNTAKSYNLERPVNVGLTAAGPQGATSELSAIGATDNTLTAQDVQILQGGIPQ